MATCIVLFDLGIYRLNYLEVEDYSVFTNDSFLKHEFRDISNSFNMELEDFNITISL